MLYISRDSAGVRGVREKGKDYKAYQHLGEQSSKYHSQWLFKMWEKNKTKQNKKQKKTMQNWGIHLPLQTIMYKVVFSVKHFIWMSKSIIFTDQMFTMDIPTEGAQKTVSSKRWQHCLTLAENLWLKMAFQSMHSWLSFCKVQLLSTRTHSLELLMCLRPWLPPRWDSWTYTTPVKQNI